MKRALALVVGFCFVGAGLSGQWHRSHVAHARCAEHGSAIHVHGATGDYVTVVANAAGVEAVPGDTSHDEHVHCPLEAFARKPDFGLPAGAFVMLELVPLVEAHSVACTLDGDGRSALFYAPKQSPPIFRAG